MNSTMKMLLQCNVTVCLYVVHISIIGNKTLVKLLYVLLYTVVSLVNFLNGYTIRLQNHFIINKSEIIPSNTKIIFWNIQLKFFVCL